MTIGQTTPAKPPIGAIIVLAMAVFIYAGMMANLDQMQNANTDAMGRGMASGFGLLFLIVEWVLLAILLLIGGINGAMPAWSAIAAAILLPVSGFSAGIALGLLEDDASLLYRLVPGLLAPIMAAYALWARLPALHRALPPLPTSLVAWFAVALIAAAPLPRYAAEQAARPAPGPPQKSALQVLDDEEKKIRADTVTQYRALTPASPLWEWDNFFDDPEFGPQAIAAARQLSHRQADAEAELRMGIGTPLLRHDEIDLAATPAFCTAASAFLVGNAKEHRTLSPEMDFLAAREYFVRYEPGMRWLMQSGCKLDDAIAGMREVIAGFKETDGRDAYLTHLAEFK
jgi:hypothetical protein